MIVPLRPSRIARKNPHMNSRSSRHVVILWLTLGLALTAMTGLFTLASPRFGYDVMVRDMPVFWLTGGLVAAGLLYLALPWLIHRTVNRLPDVTRALLWLVIGAGLAMRLILFASEPVLEDDYQRYLWDGAVTAEGLNPYQSTPEKAKFAAGDSPLGRLAIQSGLVLERVNHPELRTLYPPVAQAAFALAYKIAPFSLTAWRALILALDIAALGLLVLLLREVGRSPLWAALYWWNPIVLKELFNSAHMEALLVPLILAALVLAAKKRPLLASASLLLAAGAKIWPALLLPLIWRPLLATPWRAATACVMALATVALFASPMVLAGLDDSSGLVAYAQKWKTNSALFPMIEAGFALLPGSATPGTLARMAIALVLGALSLWTARTTARDADDLTRRALLICAAMFLLSPAQFPWYFLWVLPLLACRPSPALLLATATLPLYYSAFYFLARDNYEVFKETIVWFVWIPVWLALAYETGLAGLGARLLRRPGKAGAPT